MKQLTHASQKLVRLVDRGFTVDKEQKMSASNDAQRCDFCKSGQVIRRNEQIAFRQLINGRYVFCRVTIPLGVCDPCGSKHWTQDAEAIVDDTVRREYERLRSS